jgi:hypothetical protein
MKKLEMILIAGAIIGLLLSLFNVPVHTLIVSAFFLVLSLLYFYLGFALFNGIHLRKIFTAESYKGLGSWRIGVAIGTGIAISQITIGIMSTILDYPMAKTLIQVGLVFTAVMLLVAYIKSAKEKHQFYRNIILRCAVFIIIAIIFLLLPEKLVQTA